MNKKLRLHGELIVTEDGSVLIGNEELGSVLYEWCNGRCDNVHVEVNDISEQDWPDDEKDDEEGDV